jgi:hypothetical protein
MEGKRGHLALRQRAAPSALLLFGDFSMALTLVVHVFREEIFKCIIISIDLKVWKREDTRATSGG